MPSELLLELPLLRRHRGAMEMLGGEIMGQLKSFTPSRPWFPVKRRLALEKEQTAENNNRAKMATLHQRNSDITNELGRPQEPK
jgi:hypothetical protein